MDNKEQNMKPTTFCQSKIPLQRWSGQISRITSMTLQCSLGMHKASCMPTVQLQLPTLEGAKIELATIFAPEKDAMGLCFEEAIIKNK